MTENEPPRPRTWAEVWPWIRADKARLYRAVTLAGLLAFLTVALVAIAVTRVLTLITDPAAW